MIHSKPDKSLGKGWFIGPWNSAIAIPVGYANEAVNDPHRHARMNEIYLVARGGCTAIVNGETIQLTSGDMLLVEPGEAHTFTAQTPDYFHFVIRTPFVQGDKLPAGPHSTMTGPGTEAP